MSIILLHGNAYRIPIVNYDDDENDENFVKVKRENFTNAQVKQTQQVLETFASRATRENFCAIEEGMTEDSKLYTAITMANEQRSLAFQPSMVCSHDILDRKLRRINYPSIHITLKEGEYREVLYVTFTGDITLCPSGITILPVQYYQAEDAHALVLVIDSINKQFYGYDPHGEQESTRLTVMLADVFNKMNEYIKLDPLQSFWRDSKNYTAVLLDMDGLLDQIDLEDEAIIGFSGICSYQTALVVYLMSLLGFQQPSSVQAILSDYMDLELVRKAINGFGQTLLLRHTSSFSFTEKLQKRGLYDKDEIRANKRRKL